MKKQISFSLVFTFFCSSSFGVGIYAPNDIRKNQPEKICNSESEANLRNFYNIMDRTIGDYFETTDSIYRTFKYANCVPISNEWVLTTKNLVNSLSPTYNLTKTITDIDKISEGKIKLNVRNIIDHPTEDLVLIKTFFKDQPNSSSFRFMQRARNYHPNYLTMLLTHVINVGSPINKISIKGPNVHTMMNYTNGFLFLNQKEQIQNNNRKFESIPTYNIKFYTYPEDNSNPIICCPNADVSNLKQYATVLRQKERETNEFQICGIATKTDGWNITGLDITCPEINGWIDYTILSDALK